MPVHTAFHSPDLSAASGASIAFISDYIGKTFNPKSVRVVSSKTKHPTDPMVFLDFEYIISNLFVAEFHVVETSMIQTDGVENILHELLSSSQVFSSGQGKAVRFIVPSRPSGNAFPLMLRRMVEKFSSTSVFVIVCTSLSHLGSAKERFASMAVRCNRYMVWASVPVIDDLVDVYFCQTKDKPPERVFQLAHALSFKLCGTPMTVSLLSRSLLNVARAQNWGDGKITELIKSCVASEVIRANKVSILFDLVLFNAATLSNRA